MKRITLITGNKNKEKEIRAILEKFEIDVEIIDINLPEIQSESLEEIALDYARKAYGIIKKPLICEDAGLFIDILNGFPGPYSSFVFKSIGNEGILKLMEGKKERKATFVSVIAYKDPEKEMIFKGEVIGSIVNEKRGLGWGFDPIFMPVGSTKTFGEMDIEEKNNFSHRGKATFKFAEWYLNYKA